MKALVESEGVVIAEDVRRADNFLARLRGLMYTRELPEGRALLLSPCNSIHTFGMRFAIDVLFLGHGGLVLKVVRSLNRGKVVGPVSGGRSVLEMAAGGLPGESILEGKKIRFID